MEITRVPPGRPPATPLIQFFAKAVDATAAELLELEVLGRTVQEDYAGDAGLSTEVGPIFVPLTL